MDNLKTKTNWKYKIDKLLFIFAALYLMTTVAWFWKQKQQFQILTNTAQNPKKTTTVNNNQPLKNERIKTSGLNNQKLLDNSKPLTLIPSIPLPVIEEISNTASLNKIAPVPLPPPPPNNVIQNPQPVSPPSKPAKIIPSPKKLTSVPTLNNLNAVPIEEAEEIAINNIPSSSTEANTEETKYNHSLVGIVQLTNNKSFALFKINDITEKVPIGTEIGTSGWVLMAVNDKQVTVSRQNKSRNIRVGEKF